MSDDTKTKKDQATPRRRSYLAPPSPKKPGTVCGACGNTMTAAEYSAGESMCCNAEVTSEEEFGRHAGETDGTWDDPRYEN